MPRISGTAGVMSFPSRFVARLVPDSKAGKILASLLIATLVGLSLVLYLGVRAFKHDRDEFLRSVHVGMTKAEVLATVGKPDIELEPGQDLPVWGSSPSRRLTAESWVYFVFPKSQHRIVLTFADDELEDVEYSAN